MPPKFSRACRSCPSNKFLVCIQTTHNFCTQKWSPRPTGHLCLTLSKNSLILMTQSRWPPAWSGQCFDSKLWYPGVEGLVQVHGLCQWNMGAHPQRGWTSAMARGNPSGFKLNTGALSLTILQPPLDLSKSAVAEPSATVNATSVILQPGVPTKAVCDTTGK